MSQFVVGQWVECVEEDRQFAPIVEKGKFYRIESAVHDEVRLEGVGYPRKSFRFRPVTWEVGATYELEVPGAFGKVLSIDENGDIYGNITGQPLILSNYWHARTGKDFNEQRGANLTPRRVVAEAKSEAKPQIVTMPNVVSFQQDTTAIDKLIAEYEAHAALNEKIAAEYRDRAEMQRAMVKRAKELKGGD